MLLVITESEEGIEGLVAKLFEESFLQKEEKLKLIRKCNLEEMAGATPWEIPPTFETKAS